jgi:hypothetical protein
MPDHLHPPRRSISESPWYWIYLFCTVGLVLLVLMEPKVIALLARDTNQAVGRQRAWQQQMGQDPAAEMATAEQMKRFVRSLYAILGSVLLVGWIVFWWQQYRRRLGGQATDA